MRFGDAFEESAIDLVGNFGENVEFRPYGGTAIPTVAVVRRRTEPAPMGHKGGRPIIDVTFDASVVSLAAINFDRDSVGVATFRGEELTNFRLTGKASLLHESPGRFTVRVH